MPEYSHGAKLRIGFWWACGWLTPPQPTTAEAARRARLARAKESVRRWSEEHPFKARRRAELL